MRRSEAQTDKDETDHQQNAGQRIQAGRHMRQ
jgi:hypothetical protein